jgi:hypothetical protein
MRECFLFDRVKKLLAGEHPPPEKLPPWAARLAGQIARREYAYLPLFVHRKKTLTLHRMMAESPEFYSSPGSMRLFRTANPRI